jgi:hypothetical protein
MKNNIRTLLFLVISGLAFSVSATDGDVVYSAPYIWVNPDTGQIETVNPGPRLKAHEAVVATEAAESTGMGSTENTQMVASESEIEAVAHTSMLHPLIVLIGIGLTVGVIVMVRRKTT